eukprot:TRINITY_DN51559_c0_g1_i1.p1 TRINITY_DN51559_c0_g1~~TRINITY_DN51559_c0_g1_i1.p1  ORF type:complete len:143 (-),score=23.48 TRINITY_DN51559_c0_g1_i1:31-459(-)
MCIRDSSWTPSSGQVRVEASRSELVLAARRRAECMTGLAEDSTDLELNSYVLHDGDTFQAAGITTGAQLKLVPRRKPSRGANTGKGTEGSLGEQHRRSLRQRKCPNMMLLNVPASAFADGPMQEDCRRLNLPRARESLVWRG